MRIGIVCPYSWDVPGGVQAHVRDLAEALQARGHDVSVLAPYGDEDSAEPLPPYVVPAGRPVPVRYNGSVARLAFGPATLARTRRWLRQGDFDVLHVHEPAAPSVSLLACIVADGPIVATLHTAYPRSRALAALGTALQPALEKVLGRIAVSEAARRVVVEHLGGDAVLIPNGVTVSRFADAEPLPGWPGEGGAIGFLGRLDEPRKGLPVLLRAFARLAPERPGLRLLVAGPGDADEARAQLPAALQDRLVLLGAVPDATKASVYASVDVFVAPNTGGESFGIVLAEALATGAPVVASDLDAFRRVLADGSAGALFPVGDDAALAAVLARLLDDEAERRRLAAAGRAAVMRYDWSRVADQVLGVYETVLAVAPAGIAERRAALAATAGARGAGGPGGGGGAPRDLPPGLPEDVRDSLEADDDAAAAADSVAGLGRDLGVDLDAADDPEEGDGDPDDPDRPLRAWARRLRTRLAALTEDPRPTARQG